PAPRRVAPAVRPSPSPRARRPRPPREVRPHRGTSPSPLLLRKCAAGADGARCAARRGRGSGGFSESANGNGPRAELSGIVEALPRGYPQMTNDAKLGMLAGVLGVVVAAVVFNQHPPQPAPAQPRPEATAAAQERPKVTATPSANDA